MKNSECEIFDLRRIKEARWWMYREEMKFFSNGQKKDFSNVSQTNVWLDFSKNKEFPEIKLFTQNVKKRKTAFFGYVAWMFVERLDDENKMINSRFASIYRRDKNWKIEGPCV